MSAWLDHEPAIRLPGPDPVVVLLFELILSVDSLWTHVDFALPQAR